MKALAIYLFTVTLAKWVMDYRWTVAVLGNKTLGERVKEDSMFGYAFLLAFWPVTFLIAGTAAFIRSPASDNLKNAFSRAAGFVKTLSITEAYERAYRNLTKK